jgi:hypothetical protein
MLDKLETPPSSSDLFLWADFVELRALTHPDKCFSRGDLIGIGNRGQDTNVDRIAAEDYETEEANSNINTRMENRWRGVIQFAELRKSEFDDAYPFTISDDRDCLTYSPSEDSQAAQHLYINLLFASLLRHFPRTETGSIARFFEETSLALFKKLMPEGSEIRPTWASGGEDAPYQGTLFEKLQLIARDIRGQTLFELRDFNNRDTGDGGIDMISWHPMSDSRKSIPIAFAQCGCSVTDWTYKQIEASPEKLGTLIHVKHPWSTYYFMPLDLRASDGGWARESDIGKTIIVDRLRLIRLIKQYNLLSQITDLPHRQQVLAEDVL